MQTEAHDDEVQSDPRGRALDDRPIERDRPELLALAQERRYVQAVMDPLDTCKVLSLQEADRSLASVERHGRKERLELTCLMSARSLTSPGRQVRKADMKISDLWKKVLNTAAGSLKSRAFAGFG